MGDPAPLFRAAQPREQMPTSNIRINHGISFATSPPSSNGSQRNAISLSCSPLERSSIAICMHAAVELHAKFSVQNQRYIISFTRLWWIIVGLQYQGASFSARAQSLAFYAEEQGLHFYTHPKPTTILLDRRPHENWHMHTYQQLVMAHGTCLASTFPLHCDCSNFCRQARSPTPGWQSWEMPS